MLKWNVQEDYRTGDKRYFAVYGGVLGAPDAYPCLFCEILKTKNYNNKGKAQTRYIVKGSISYEKKRGNGLKRVDLKAETATVKEAKDYVQAAFDKVVK